MVEKVQEYAKAVVAVLGAVVLAATALADGVQELADVVTALLATLTAAGVYAVPNKDPDIKS